MHILSTYCMPSWGRVVRYTKEQEVWILPPCGSEFGKRRPTSNEQIQQSCKTLHRPPCFRLPISNVSSQATPHRVRCPEASGMKPMVSPLAHLTLPCSHGSRAKCRAWASLVPRPSFPRVDHTARKCTSRLKGRPQGGLFAEPMEKLGHTLARRPS